MFEIQYLIYIYIILCMCMMIFNICYILYNRSSEKRNINDKYGIAKKMNKEFDNIKNGEKVSRNHLKYLSEKLKNTDNLFTFENILDKQKKDIVEKYLESVQFVFDDLIIFYLKQENINKAYFSYILLKYNISKDKRNSVVRNNLFSFLENESIYCRVYTLKAIIKLGGNDEVLKALRIITETNYYYDAEVIMNSLLLYDENNLENLISDIWNNFYSYSLNIQIAIIRIIDKLQLDYRVVFYEMLINQTIKSKIKVEIVKYYKNNTYLEITGVLQDILLLQGRENKELIIQTIKTITKYVTEDVKETLKKLLNKKDWDLRMAASESLIEIGTNYYDLVDIYNGEDKIAREILKYKVQSSTYKKK